MHTLSLLNGISTWDKFLAFFDLIPKVIYFLYTCLASAVDAMQMLARRICGLDVYYVGGEEVINQDPITQFVNGILGFGDSAGAYQALNTTFWSLAIFALILLALSSMIAIIKAHYNEDTSKTNPSKILYNAFKSIVTFAIVPFAVIIGIQLSSLLLRTLDNITNTPATEEALEGIYGPGATTYFFREVDERQGEDSTITQKIYSSYDMFGAGAPSTNAPISGMLFKAAAYNSNRFRNGDYNYKTQMLLDMGTGGNLFGNTNSPGYNSAEDKQEYVAYQVDYAFMNNLHFQSEKSYYSLSEEAVDCGLIVWNRIDVFAQAMFDSFSKYNVSLIWLYYDLWQFNFIVAFAGVFAVFGMMISIILGLMIRLIKTAAMFLIYPPLLGLAPMDDFKAFKSWSNEFIKQILSTYGAVIGLNLLFLILPYVQTITFFNVGILDAIVNVVFLIAGLVMAKDFISMVAGFVGGGDVFSTGEGAKGNVGKSLTKGLKAATGVGMVPAKAIKTGASLAVRTGKSIGAGIQLRRRNNALQNYYKEEESFVEDRAGKAAYDNTTAFAQSVMRNADAKKAYDDAMSGKADTAENREAAYKKAEKVLYEKDETYKKEKDTSVQQSMAQSKINKFRTKEEKEAGINITGEELEKRMQAKANANYLNFDGTASGKGFLALMQNTTAGFRGSIKNLFSKDMLSNIGLDKMTATVKDMTGIFMSRDAAGNALGKKTQYEATKVDVAARRAEIKEEARKKGTALSEDKIREKMSGDVKTKINWAKAKDTITAALREFGNTIFTGSNLTEKKEEKFTDDKLPKKQYDTAVETNKKIDNMSEAIKDLVSFLKSKP